MPSVPAGWIVTFDVRSGNPAALALITAVPVAMAVTLKPTDCVPCENRTDGGTVATFVLLELRVKVIGLGAGAESFSVSVPSLFVPVILRLAGVSVAVVPIVT